MQNYFNLVEPQPIIPRTIVRERDLAPTRLRARHEVANRWPRVFLTRPPRCDFSGVSQVTAERVRPSSLQTWARFAFPPVRRTAQGDCNLFPCLV